MFAIKCQLVPLSVATKETKKAPGPSVTKAKRRYALVAWIAWLSSRMVGHHRSPCLEVESDRLAAV